MNKGDILRQQGENIQNKFYIGSLFGFKQPISQIIETGNAYIAAAEAYFTDELYEHAGECYIKAINYFKKVDHNKNEIYYEKAANCFEKINNLKMANLIYKEAIELTNSLQKYKYSAKFTIAIINNYKELGEDNEKIIECYEQAYNYYNLAKYKKIAVTECILNLATIYLNMGEYKKAFDNYSIYFNEFMPPQNRELFKALLCLYLLDDLSNLRNTLNEFISKDTLKVFICSPEYKFINSLLELELEKNSKYVKYDKFLTSFTIFMQYDKYCEICYDYDNIRSFNSDVTNLLLKIKEKYFKNV